MSLRRTTAIKVAILATILAGIVLYFVGVDTGKLLVPEKKPVYTDRNIAIGK